MLRTRLASAAVGCLVVAASAAGASAQDTRPDVEWDATLPWITLGEDVRRGEEGDPVLESLPPGMTQLGRTPPNELPGESTDELQALVDEAHGDESGRERGGEPPPIRPIE